MARKENYETFQTLMNAVGNKLFLEMKDLGFQYPWEQKAFTECIDWTLVPLNYFFHKNILIPTRLLSL